MASWTDIPEYEKILKHIVEEFLAEFELYDYETENWNRNVKKCLISLLTNAILGL